MQQGDLTRILLAVVFTGALVGGSLWILQRYGPIFLEPAVYRRRLEERFAEYDAFLGEAWLGRRADAEFWSYHRRALEWLGRPLRPRRLVASALARAVRYPGRALRRLVTRAANSTPATDPLRIRVAEARRHARDKRAEIERAAPLVTAWLGHVGAGVHDLRGR